MQTGFELAGVAAGSLDRADSPNVDITWTDGAHLRYRTKAGWNWHMILQRNAAEGPTNVRLFPLSFEDSDSRVSYFAAAESLEPYGPIVQRAFAVSYLPSSLRTDGTAAGPVEDYLAIVGRLAAQWPAGVMPNCCWGWSSAMPLIRLVGQQWARERRVPPTDSRGRCSSACSMYFLGIASPFNTGVRT